MEILGPAPATPDTKTLIAQLAKPIGKVMSGEMADEADVDRVWILRALHKAYLYYRDLAYFAPALYQGLVDSTGIDGTMIPSGAYSGTGLYDYTQNVYRGYCRKLEAVLGTRIPNAIAVPNDPSSEDDVRASRAANDAAQYIRQECDLQVLILWLVFSLYNFGTSFWNIEWEINGDKYGYKDVPVPPVPTEQKLGGADSGVPEFPVTVPQDQPPKQVEKGGLKIEICDASEISVPLDTDGREGTGAANWLRREREVYKGRLFQKYGDTLREQNIQKDTDSDIDDAANMVSLQYGQSVRSAMASPIGIVRPKRENNWTVIEEDWTPVMYEMVDDKAARQLLKEQFPTGVRITAVKGKIVNLEGRKLADHWQECQPEPTKRIMCDPLGQDWIVTQDLLNNLLNQQNETIERSNEPGFADPTRVDLDAYQRRRSEPLDLIPALRPPGGTLADLIFRPNPPQFSDQIVPFRGQVEQTSQQNSGLLEIIWGGDTSDPTARQSELKTNAAIRQLSVIWVMIGKSLEKVYEKACKLLAENEDGVLAFSKQKPNEYGKFDSISIVIKDLKGGSYHFEADEAIPMTWGQQRDLLMWMLDKPVELLKAWGLDDPMNIFEFKQLLGMPGQRTPYMADRDKGMAIISELVNGKPQLGPVDPATGQPGPKQPSIAPDWEDDSEFMAKLAKAYLVDNFELKAQNPDGYENIQLWGQAHEQKANVPPPKPPVKGSVAVSLKGPDLGDAAVTSALQDIGVLQPGQQAQAVPPPPKPGQMMPPPGGPPSASVQ